MADNSNSASGNSWTLLTPQESRVENVGPEAEGTKTEGEPSSSTALEPLTKGLSDLMQHSSDAAELQPQTEPSSQQQTDPAHTHTSEHAKGTLSPQSPQVAPPETSDDRAQLNVNEDSTSVSGTVEDLSSWTPDHEEQSAPTGYSKSLVSPRADGDLFSDSYTHVSPNSGSSRLPASVCQGGEEFKIEESSYLRKTITEEYKPDVEVLETKGMEADGLRKRPISQMGPLDQGKTEVEDDEEGDEEEFQPPQKVEETVFSLNKCILAAVIFLGLGTIFFSGLLMDLDDEGDIDVREQKDPTNQEWLNPEVSRDTPVGLKPPDILSKQAKEDQQILILQAQLQQHLSELKAAQLLAEEGEKERVKREELEKEYQRIKGELDRLPAIQKELEQENVRMKEQREREKRELDALPSLHRELEHLRETVSQLTQSTGQSEPVHPVAASGMPSTGEIRDVPPIERQEIKLKKHWNKKSGEKEQSRGDKEEKNKKGGNKEDKQNMKNPKYWKKDKSNQEQGKAWKSKDERKEWQEDKELKKDKKREDSKTVKENGEKKSLKEWEEKKDKKRIKDKHGGQNERRVEKKEWKETGNKKVKDEKEWKQRGERKNEREEKEWKPRGEQKDWKEDKEWKNDKESARSDRKEKKKEWKEKDEWKGEKEWGKGKREGKVNEKTEKKWKLDGEFPKMYAGKETQKKHLEKRGKEKEWSKDGAWKREGIKEEKKSKACYHKNEGKNCHNVKEKPHKDEKELSNKERHRHGPTDETSNHYHNDREIYWAEQRRRIQHYHDRRETCSGVADCARAEGLAPVSLRDFEMLFQNYLEKLPDPEDQISRKEELRKFVKEFFTDGVFAHDQMPFSEFVEDVGDILEDMAEAEESELEDSEEDNDEMEEFEREMMEKFALPKEVGKVEKKGERKKESGRVKN